MSRSIRNYFLSFGISADPELLLLFFPSASLPTQSCFFNFSSAARPIKSCFIDFYIRQHAEP